MFVGTANGWVDESMTESKTAAIVEPIKSAEENILLGIEVGSVSIQDQEGLWPGYDKAGLALDIGFQFWLLHTTSGESLVNGTPRSSKDGSLSIVRTVELPRYSSCSNIL